MPRLIVDSVGAVGVVKDISSHRLDPRAWSDAKNIRFSNLGAHRVKGYSRPAGITPIAPFGAFPFRPLDIGYWLLPGNNKIYQFDGSTYTNITRQSGGLDLDYAGFADARWVGSPFQGSFILNNGIDAPQAWTFPYGATRLIDLPNWPVNTSARVVRPFKNYLVALFTSDGAVFKPHNVRWSHPADPGTLPISWELNNPAVDSGEVDLAETSDTLVDCLTLRDSNIIYKETTTWRMTPNRNQFVFDFPLVFRSVGMLAPGCAVEYNGRHIVLTTNDLVIHDGVASVDSIVEAKVREWLFANIDRTNYHKTFLFLHETKKEVWVCFPFAGSTWCNIALVVSLTSADWAIRDLPQVAGLAWGPLTESNINQTWDNTVGSWDSASGPWETPPSAGHLLSMMIAAVPDSSRIFKFDDSPQNDGVNFESFLERVDVPLGPEQGGQIVADYSRTKITQRIYPVINAPKGTAFKISYGGKKSLSDQVQWRDPKVFRVGIDKYIEPWFRTHSLALKFSTEAPVEWTMENYTIEFEMGGME